MANSPHDGDGGNSFMSQFQGLKQAGRGTDIFSLMSAFYGVPYYSRKDGGMTSANEQIFNANVRAGRDPSTHMPYGTGGNPAAPTTGGELPPATPPNQVGYMPAWWQDWYNSQGKFGGVPQVPGIL